MGNITVKNKSRKFLTMILRCFCIILFAFTALSTTLLKVVFDTIFTRYSTNEHSGNLTYHDVRNEYERSVVHFHSEGNLLQGYLYGAENKKGLVVMAHGLGGGAESFLAETLYFVDQGWCVFSYDCTGSYESEGNSTKGLPQSVVDLQAALTYIKRNSSLMHLPVMLFGHSWGGYAVTAVLNYNYDIDAVVSVSGFNSPVEIMMEKAKQFIGPLAKLEYPFVLSQQSIRFRYTNDLTAVNGINRSDTRIMIIHGELDHTVSFHGAGIIAHRKEITNPNVIYLTRNTANRSGHKHLFLTDSAYQYRDEIKKQYIKQSTVNSKNNSLGDVLSESNEAIDLKKASELDIEFMSKINTFYENSLSNRLVKQ